MAALSSSSALRAASSHARASLAAATLALTAFVSSAHATSNPGIGEEDEDRNGAQQWLSITSDTPFYVPPATLPATNGNVIRREPMSFYLDPINLIRVPAQATRIMYRSTNAAGQPIAVTGTALVPNTPWLGLGRRPLIGYGAGTQGVADRCAPSRALSLGQEYEGPMITALLAAGYGVVVTDYEALGTPGIHTYMVRAAQGHAVLDSVRAFQRLGLAGIDSRNPVALVGYSQGGGASASAAELAPTYAPELNLKGAYAGAVPADLKKVANQIDGGLYSAFLLFAVTGMFEAYGLDQATYLNAKGLARATVAADNCVVDGLLAHAFTDSSTLTVSGQHMKDLVRTDPTLSAILNAQKLGVGRAPRVPVLLSHSVLDDVIPYAAGRELAQRWCDQGTRVEWDTHVSPTHLGAYVTAVPRVMAFLAARFAGFSTTNSCWRL